MLKKFRMVGNFKGLRSNTVAAGLGCPQKCSTSTLLPAIKRTDEITLQVPLCSTLLPAIKKKKITLQVPL